MRYKTIKSIQNDFGMDTFHDLAKVCVSINRGQFESRNDFLKSMSNIIPIYEEWMEMDTDIIFIEFLKTKQRKQKLEKIRSKMNG